MSVRIAVLCLLAVLFSWGQGLPGSGAPRLVQGIGYPPVKAKNQAQALLMARRAAMLDAYRNIVQGHEHEGDGMPERDAYERFSAFVRGVTLVDEALLADGGVRITVRVSSGASLSERQGEAALVTGTGGGRGNRSGPRRVTEKEWYGIIEQMVRFEGKPGRKGE